MKESQTTEFKKSLEERKEIIENRALNLLKEYKL